MTISHDDMLLLMGALVHFSPRKLVFKRCITDFDELRCMMKKFKLKAHASNDAFGWHIFMLFWTDFMNDVLQTGKLERMRRWSAPILKTPSDNAQREATICNGLQAK